MINPFNFKLTEWKYFQFCGNQFIMINFFLNLIAFCNLCYINVGKIYYTVIRVKKQEEII